MYYSSPIIRNANVKINSVKIDRTVVQHTNWPASWPSAPIATAIG